MQRNCDEEMFCIAVYATPKKAGSVMHGSNARQNHLGASYVDGRDGSRAS
jgi:hypothetical protein